MTLAADFRTLLLGIAEEAAPLEAVEDWFHRHQDALRADSSLAFKAAVQEALAHAWSWRERRATDVQTRAAIRALLGRLPG